MAGNIADERGSKAKSSHKRNIKVDLTPMVDLGFLLITFFVFTATISAPKAMNIMTPDDKGLSTDQICESCAITVIAAADDKILYYEGRDTAAVYSMIGYDPRGLRTILLKKKRRAAALGLEAVLIIKPSSRSTFKNLVDIIDESTICTYKKYYLDNLTASEEKKIK